MFHIDLSTSLGSPDHSCWCCGNCDHCAGARSARPAKMQSEVSTNSTNNIDGKLKHDLASQDPAARRDSPGSCQGGPKSHRAGNKSAVAVCHKPRLTAMGIRRPRMCPSYFKNYVLDQHMEAVDAWCARRYGVGAPASLSDVQKRRLFVRKGPFGTYAKLYGCLPRA